MSVRVWIGEGSADLCEPALRALGDGFGTRLAVPEDRAERALASLGCAALPGAALGPLAVARFGRGLDPRETGFALRLGSVLADGVLADPGEVSADEAEEAGRLAACLRSGRLDPMFGLSADHALVWREGSTDLVATDWPLALGNPWQASLPQGDGEAVLRRFVDDSVNVLASSEANRLRGDQGRPPLNVLWPWAPGFGFELPRLVLRYGAPLKVETSDWAVEGAARLAGVSLRGEAPLAVRVGPLPWETTDDPDEQAYLARRERSTGWLSQGTAACTLGPFGWHHGPPEAVPWEAALDPDQMADPEPLVRWVARLLRQGGRPVG
ncbi:MAG: hypothetical protein AB7F50_11635 [Fimbriimonadaceae bacterium]